MEPRQSVNVNLILLGDSGVGKTSILKRLKGEKFNENYEKTIMCDEVKINRQYDEKDLTFIFNFQDTSGSESDLNSAKQKVEFNHILLLVFDTLNTLDILKKRWEEYYKENLKENAMLILIGNKSDSFEDEREKIMRQGEDFAKEINADFITCSAKSNFNINELDNKILTKAKELFDNEILDPFASVSIRLSKSNLRDKKDKSCNC